MIQNKSKKNFYFYGPMEEKNECHRWNKVLIFKKGK